MVQNGNPKESKGSKMELSALNGKKCTFSSIMFADILGQKIFFLVSQIIKSLDKILDLNNDGLVFILVCHKSSVPGIQRFWKWSGSTFMGPEIFSCIISKNFFQRKWSGYSSIFPSFEKQKK
jgi:hypothetical protein